MSESQAPEATTAVAAPEAQTANTFTAEYVQSLRQEAARYRTEKNDAVDAAKSIVQTEWETKLSAEVSKTAEEAVKREAAELSLAKIQAAITAGVPTDKIPGFVKTLTGTDEASLKASAEENVALFGGFNNPIPATDPTQGSGGVPPLALNGDPLLALVSKVVGAS